ncbi:hypothetical protein RhiirA4_477303 [Rhizophagus irregularis]|uniref:Uncharacterized protein n=1 Tax=Rhizophagus irregularis TaxID=588596 RepID=A0A2I1HD11_9GLOM|nr:hypothetical protein RhiirA4_477303 [Rhizophagus irregularis]
MDLEIVCSEKIHEIQDNNKYFEHCMNDIFILNKTLWIIGRDLMEEEFSMRPEFEIIGEESSGRADYEIKEVKSRIKELEEK